MQTASEVISGVIIYGLIVVCVSCACILIINATFRWINGGRTGRRPLPVYARGRRPRLGAGLPIAYQPVQEGMSWH